MSGSLPFTFDLVAILRFKIGIEDPASFSRVRRFAFRTLDLYLICNERPNKTYAQPSQKHLDVALELVKYLAYTEELGLVYSRSGNRRPKL